MDILAKTGIIRGVGLFSVPAPPFRFAASGGVFLCSPLHNTCRRTMCGILPGSDDAETRRDRRLMSDVFITENFLLQNDRAVELYHRYARDLPIIDYHCHLPPAEVAKDRRFENLTQIWLAGDHYKWRAMRTAGVPERFCTGDASDREKFQKWAETVPQTLRNPLYHWTHLELKRPLGISDRLWVPRRPKGFGSSATSGSLGRSSRPGASCGR